MRHSMPENDSAEEFGRLVREHESRLYGYVFGIHPNRADVEDILQETTRSRIFRQIESLRQNPCQQHANERPRK